MNTRIVLVGSIGIGLLLGCVYILNFNENTNAVVSDTVTATSSVENDAKVEDDVVTSARQEEINPTTVPPVDRKNQTFVDTSTSSLPDTAENAPTVAFVVPQKNSSVKPGQVLRVTITASNCDTVGLIAFADVQTQECANDKKNYTFTHTVQDDAVGVYTLSVIANRDQRDRSAVQFASAETQVMVSNGDVVGISYNTDSNGQTGSIFRVIYSPELPIPSTLMIYLVYGDGNKEALHKDVTFDGYDTSVIKIENPSEDNGMTYRVYGQKPDGAKTSITARYQGYSVVIPVETIE